MKTRHVIIVSALLVLILGMYIASGNLSREGGVEESFGDLSSEDFREYWAQTIKPDGAEEAYEKFVVFNRGEKAGIQHGNAHTFGGVLYEEVGRDGLSACDSSFSFGCYHEFLGTAVSAEGLPVVYKLNEACFEDLGGRALSCQHGIGHGIQTHFGYEFDHLASALQLCGKLPYSDPIGGCYGGVFMEYNLRTMLSSDGVGIRLQNPEDLHEPCSQLSEETLPACYYWQPQWWSGIFAPKSDVIESYKKMGELCHEVQGEELRRECFEGIGNIAGQGAGYDPVKTIELCRAVSGDDIYELYCRADAANSFYVLPKTRARASLVCEGLEGEMEEHCLQYSSNAFNKLIRGPSLQ